MATNISNGDILTVRQEYANADSVGFNLLYYKVSGLIETSSGLPPAVAVPFLAPGADIAQAMFDNFKTLWAAVASSSCSMTGCTVQDIWPTPRSRPVTYTAPTPQAGAVAGDALPAQDSITILKKTVYGQRWGMGRVFVYGLPEAAQNQGSIVSGSRANLESLASVYAAPFTMSADLYTLTLIPMLFGQKGFLSGNDTRVVEAAIESWVLKTQRRRRPGKGI